MLIHQEKREFKFVQNAFLFSVPGWFAVLLHGFEMLSPVHHRDRYISVN